MSAWSLLLLMHFWHLSEKRVNKNNKRCKPRNSAWLKLWPRESLRVFGAAPCEEGSIYNSLIMSSSCIQPDVSVRAPRHLCVRETTWASNTSVGESATARHCFGTPFLLLSRTLSNYGIRQVPLRPPPPPHFFVLPVKSPAVCHFISVPARFTFVLLTPLIVSRSNLVFPFHLPATHYLLVTYRNLA